MSIWTSFVKIWKGCSSPVVVNLKQISCRLYHLLFDLETIRVSQIIILRLILEKKLCQFWWEIWIRVLVILLQLYGTYLHMINTSIICDE